MIAVPQWLFVKVSSAGSWPAQTIRNVHIQKHIRLESVVHGKDAADKSSKKRPAAAGFFTAAIYIRNVILLRGKDRKIFSVNIAEICTWFLKQMDLKNFISVPNVIKDMT